MLKKTELESLSIIHWNSNSLKNKLEEFNLFIKKFSPDITTIITISSIN
jgi:exonuclease III